MIRHLYEDHMHMYLPLVGQKKFFFLNPPPLPLQGLTPGYIACMAPPLDPTAQVGSPGPKGTSGEYTDWFGINSIEKKNN